MKFQVEVVCLDGACEDQRHTVLTIERPELAMETLGMSLAEGKALLSGVQDVVIEQQAQEYLEQQRACPECGRRYTSKDAGTTAVKTVFGSVPVANPRWNCCSCQSAGRRTFRPMRRWLKERTSPEMMYLETKWGSLIPFAKVADLLCDVLPVDDSVNAETVRTHLHTVAERMEEELGEEPQGNLFEGSEAEWEQQPMPDGPITIGLDGGYVRAAHKQGWFEVIAGKTVVAFRRTEEQDVPADKCFGFVQTYDDKPRRRMWELLKSQGMQENQQVVFMSDGGESVRRGVSTSLQRTSDRLVSHHHAPDRVAAANEGSPRATAPDWH